MAAMASKASAAVALKGLPCPSDFSAASSSSASFPVISNANHRNVDRDISCMTTSFRTPGARITKYASEVVHCNFLRAFHGRRFHEQKQVPTAISATPAAVASVSESPSATANAGSGSNVEGGGAAGVTEEDDLGVFTKFIDEQLLQTLNNKDVENPVRQMHVSMDVMQEDLGDDWVDNLLRKGYRGDAPSVWAIEMPKTKIPERSLQGILSVASSLLMKGSTILGVISCPWIGISELEARALLRRLFVGQGFTLKVLSYEELTSNSHLERSGVSIGSPSDVPFAFIAQQQRLSDAQVEYAQMQVEMAEEVDEEGFEDSW